MLSPLDYWRAIVLYGANAATYTIALAICLTRFAEQNKTQGTMNELAQAFFHEYRQRLVHGLPQQTNPARKTLLERVVEAYQHGELTETAATPRVEREGFSGVVPRFHTVNRDPIPLRFYEATPRGLILTDARLSTVQGNTREALHAEAASRSRSTRGGFYHAYASGSPGHR